MNRTMGRRRQSNLDLPPRMHQKSGTYYYVTTTLPRKWISLGKDIKEARKKWADLEAGTDASDRLSTLLDHWMESEAFGELSANTQKMYRSVIRQLKIAFDDMTVGEIKPKHVAQWLDEHGSKVMANTGKSVLTTVLQLAVRRGMIEHNPAKDIENIAVKRRKRYITDEEYLAIRNNAAAPLAAAMDLSYVTGARIGDILSIKLRDITEDGLMIRQEKTDKLQLFKRNAALDLAIENAKKIERPVRGLHYLLCTERGRKYQYAQMNEWWIAARTAASIPDVKFHDIRGKAATDAKKLGQDYQALLGHTSKAMSDSYIKLEEAQVAEPLRKIL